MVFNRRRKAKVQWEKQVTRVRRETKEQFDRLASDQRSAVSDLSETIYTNGSYTNGSEVDAIGAFGKNDAYGRRIGDSFTLGNNSVDEFETIADYEPAPGGYNVDQIAEDDTTYDGTFGESEQTPNYPRRGSRFSGVGTEDSGFTGDDWGNQGSYRLQGLETASDIVDQPQVEAHGRSRKAKKTSKESRDYSNIHSRSYTADSRSDVEDGTDTSDRDEYDKYLDDYDIPEPSRQSPMVVLYDTILSHPLLTCIAFPCIPCLALYVKSTEKKSIPVRPRRRVDKGKLKGNRNVKSARSKDESTFAAYNENQRRFDDISQDPDGFNKNARVRGGAKIKHRIRSVGSKTSEFSEIKSHNPGKFGLKSGFKDRSRRDLRGGVEEDSLKRFNGRPSTRQIVSKEQSDFSNIASQHRYNIANGGDASYDPVAGYDNIGNQYSLGYDSTTMDGAEHLGNDGPQGEWNYESVDERPIHRNHSNLSVGWKDTVTDNRDSPMSGTFDHTQSNGGFWPNVSDTFSTHTGRETFDQSNTSFSNPGGMWNQMDSFSGREFGYRDNDRMTQAMGTIEESTIGSDMRSGDPYYTQRGR